MQSLEKNDINLEKLFQWSDKFTILDRFGKEKLKVYIRLAGDSEMNRARVYGLRKSAELRKKLKEENSDERMALIPDKDIVEKSMIVESLVLYKTRDLTLEAINTLKINIPKEPGTDASLEEQEEYQKEIDEFPAKREKEIRNAIESKVEKIRKDLNVLGMDELFKQYEFELVNQICETEMVQRFREMCVFLCTFTDAKLRKRLTEDLEIFNNLPKDVKDQLIECYMSLELGGEDLKKLQEAMQ